MEGLETITATMAVLKLAVQVAAGIVKYVAEVSEAENSCKELIKKMEHYKYELERLISEGRACDKVNIEEHMTPFIKQLQEIDKTCKDYIGKRKAHKVLAPWNDKIVKEINNKLKKAEENFNTFLRINNVTMLAQLKKENEELRMEKSEEETARILNKAKEVADEKMKLQLSELSKKMDEHAEIMQKQTEEAAARTAEMVAKKIDQKFADNDEELGTVSKPKVHQGVVLLNGYKKKKLNLVKDKMNAVSVFFKCGLAGLKVYNETLSDEERAMSLALSISTKKMSKSYREMHSDCFKDLFV